MSTRATEEELLAAIRAKCLDCSGGSKRELRSCAMRNCPLHPYRTREARERATQLRGQTNVFEMIV